MLNRAQHREIMEQVHSIECQLRRLETQWKRASSQGDPPTLTAEQYSDLLNAQSFLVGLILSRDCLFVVR